MEINTKNASKEIIFEWIFTKLLVKNTNQWSNLCLLDVKSLNDEKISCEAHFEWFVFKYSMECRIQELNGIYCAKSTLKKEPKIPVSTKIYSKNPVAIGPIW